MSGRPFLQIPGPTLVPERIVRAMSESIIDHRGPKFAALVRECLDGLQGVFQTEKGQIMIYPGSGTGAWEACLVNTLSPGDRVLACVNGHFSTGFARTAVAYGIDVDRLDLPYGAGVPADRVEERLRADTTHQLRAVLIVHNETSTGVTSGVAAIRQALDRARAGIYAPASLEGIPGTIRERHFTPSGDGYEVRDSLRQSVSFAHLDLTAATRPPFREVDCIFCCNVLIYFQRPLQERVLNMLYASLATPGYLVLGEVETPTSRLYDKLKCVDSKAKI